MNVTEARMVGTTVLYTKWPEILINLKYFSYFPVIFSTRRPSLLVLPKIRTKFNEKHITFDESQFYNK